MSPTVREMVRTIQREIQRPDLPPHDAAELLMKATALIGNCNDAIREADMTYNACLSRLLESEGTAAAAKIKAEQTNEYRWKRETRDTKEILVEMCRALKYLLKSQEEERQLSRYQQ